MSFFIHCHRLGSGKDPPDWRYLYSTSGAHFWFFFAWNLRMSDPSKNLFFFQLLEQNLKGKMFVSKSVSIHFPTSPNHQHQWSTRFSKMGLFFLLEVMMPWTMFCMVASPRPHSAKLRHWTPWTFHAMLQPWVVLNCKIFVYTSVSWIRWNFFVGRFWKVRVPFFDHNSKRRKLLNSFWKISGSNKVFESFFEIHRLS